MYASVTISPQVLNPVLWPHGRKLSLFIIEQSHLMFATFWGGRGFFILVDLLGGCGVGVDGGWSWGLHWYGVKYMSK